MQHTRRLFPFVLVAAMVVVAGCDKVADTSRAVQQVSMSTFNDTKSSWRDFFTYHPPQPDPLPQTRYCYQMQSDVVCYDSEQPMLTSKLIGYQDGENISWVQPGGGSLGASGGEAVALRPVSVQRAQTASSSYSAVTAVDPEPSASDRGNFTSRTVVSTKGQISVGNLPPVK